MYIVCKFYLHNQGHRQGGSGTPLGIFNTEVHSQGHLQSHQPLTSAQVTCKHMHAYCTHLQHDMATHIESASGFGASARFHHDRS